MFLRYSIKALIVEAGKLLVIKKERSDVYYVLPGGGQRPEETMHEALIRECAEELGATVQVGELAFIREYCEWNHNFAGEHPGFHQVEFVFRCSIIDINGTTITAPDTYQIGTEWLPLETLTDYALYPKVIRPMFDGKDYTGPLYLGDVN